MLPENLTEDFMTLLSQCYSHVIIFKYIVFDSIPILHDTPQFVLLDIVDFGHLRLAQRH